MATQAPVMAAVRVPPSAWITSQSISDLPLAQRLHVDHRPQGAADQALDFLRAARLLARRGLAPAAGVGGARQHAVFRRDPALALAAQPAAARFPPPLAVTSTLVWPKLTRHEPSA